MSNSLLRSSAIYSLGAFLTKSFGFFLIPLYTRYLTVEEYGALALLNQILQLVSFIFLLGVSTASMRFYFNHDADDSYRERLYGNSILLVLFLPIVLCLLLGPLGYILVSRFLPSIPFYPYVLIILVIGLFTPMVTLMAGLLRVQERPKTYVLFYVSFFVFQTITIVVAVGFLGYGLNGQLVAQLIANFAFWIAALAILKRNAILRFSPEIAKSLLLFGIPFVPYLLFSWVNTASGRFLLERYTSLSEVGIFALASQFAGLIALFATAVNSAVMPYFYKTANRKDSAPVLGAFVMKYVAFFGAMGLMVAVLAEPLVVMMAHEKYYSATQYVPLLVLGSWFTLVSNTFAWSLTYSGKTGVLASIRAASAVLMVLLLVIFLKHYSMGIYGVAYSIIAVNACIIGISFVISQKLFRLSIPLFDLAIIIALLLAGFGAIQYFTGPGPELAAFLVKLVLATAIAYLSLRVAKIRMLEYLKFRKA